MKSFRELLLQAQKNKNKKTTDTGQKPDEVVVNPVRDVNRLAAQRTNEERDVMEAADEKTAVFAFGRFNPPHVGHEKLVNKVSEEAKKHGVVGHIVASHTEGKAKDPLSQKDKIHYLKKAFGSKVDVHGSSKESPTFMHHAANLYKQGHEHLVMIAGDDRAKDYEEKLNKYNGKFDANGNGYHFKSIKVISSGERDPDAEGTEGMSASKMRAHARAGEHEEFKKGLPKALHPHSREIMKKVQDIKEEAELQELSEAVVSLQARIKRAQNMRKYRARLQRGKKIAAAKMASSARLRAKTRHLARRIVKKQSVGARGWNYQTLSPADKIAIDKMMDRKLAMIQRVAARLTPQVKRAEVKRLAVRASTGRSSGTLSYVKT